MWHKNHRLASVFDEFIAFQYNFEKLAWDRKFPVIDDDYITPTLHDLLNILTLSTRNHTTILCNKIVFMEHVKPVFLEIYFHLSRMSRGLTSWYVTENNQDI